MLWLDYYLNLMYLINLETYYTHHPAESENGHIQNRKRLIKQAGKLPVFKLRIKICCKVLVAYL